MPRERFFYAKEMSGDKISQLLEFTSKKDRDFFATCNAVAPITVKEKVQLVSEGCIPVLVVITYDDDYCANYHK